MTWLPLAEALRALLPREERRTALPNARLCYKKWGRETSQLLCLTPAKEQPAGPSSPPQSCC